MILIKVFAAHVTPRLWLDVIRLTSYNKDVIRSFRSGDAEAIFQGRVSKQFGRIATVVERKLVPIHAARSLRDLAIFPGNPLEGLKADRAGQHAIRVNDQYRICFVWRDGDAYDVEVTGYH